MKPLILISLITAAFFAVAGTLLALCGLRINTAEIFAAAIITTAAGTLGIIPIVAGRRKDPVGVFQLALAGTVLHLFSAVAFSALAIFTHLVSVKSGFVYWLLAGYWVSLILLLWQLRQRLLSTLGLTKGATIS
jgi:hypothetical protein